LAMLSDNALSAPRQILTGAEAWPTTTPDLTLVADTETIH
jgi:hypothetical protein